MVSSLKNSLIFKVLFALGDCSYDLIFAKIDSKIFYVSKYVCCEPSD